MFITPLCLDGLGSRRAASGFTVHFYGAEYFGSTGTRACTCDSGCFCADSASAVSAGSRTGSSTGTSAHTSSHTHTRTRTRARASTGAHTSSCTCARTCACTGTCACTCDSGCFCADRASAVSAGTRAGIFRE